MADVEWLKKEIDTSGNEALETQEMEEFLKSEENIKKLWEAMEWKDSPELVQEIENVLKDLCDKILSQTEHEGNLYISGGLVYSIVQTKASIPNGVGAFLRQNP